MAEEEETCLECGEGLVVEGQGGRGKAKEGRGTLQCMQRVGCMGRFHASCAGFSEKEYIFMRKRGQLSCWTCKFCRDPPEDDAVPAEEELPGPGVPDPLDDPLSQSDVGEDPGKAGWPSVRGMRRCLVGGATLQIYGCSGPCESRPPLPGGLSCSAGWRKLSKPSPISGHKPGSQIGAAWQE